jgi:hypothetical protein
MWTFIIILILFFVGRFIYDTAKQSEKISREGGIRRKYSVLINHLLEGRPDCRILQEDNTFVAVGVCGAAGSTVYYIYPSYGNVSIKMEIKNNPLLGDMKMEWRFPESMSQERMIEKINSDLEQRFMSLTN